jgi:CTP-dependent riboflavin kinase
MRIKGKIVKGVGESASFLSIPWVNRQMWEKLRFQPHRGTLNIAVDDPEIQRALKAHQGDRGIIASKFECGIVLPLVPNYDECLLEIVAPVHLKDSLGLNDGDEVTLELYI